MLYFQLDRTAAETSMIVKLAFGETTLRRNEVFGFRSSEVE
jgi:hypothetical protein